MQHEVRMASGPGCHRWAEARTGIKVPVPASLLWSQKACEMYSPLPLLPWVQPGIPRLMEEHRGCLDALG